MDTNTCHGCPQDHYKNESEYYSTSCHACPPDTPRTSFVNATSMDDCQFGKYLMQNIQIIQIVDDIHLK